MIKKTIIAVLTVAATIAASIGITGCDKLPSPEKIEILSTSVGVAAGCAVDIAGTSDKDRQAILDVLDVLDDVVPEQGQSFLYAWTPVISETVDKLVADGKLDVKAAPIVKNALFVAAQGLDYMFEVRWPKAREYKDLVSSGIRGFTSGFKTIIRPSNALQAAKLDYNEDEYNRATEWFKKNLKTK